MVKKFSDRFFFLTLGNIEMEKWGRQIKISERPET